MWYGDIKTLNIWKDKPIEKKREKYIEKDISELDLSKRAYNCLKRAKCDTINSVIKFIYKDELKKIRGLGATTKSEIEDKVNLYLERIK